MTKPFTLGHSPAERHNTQNSRPPFGRTAVGASGRIRTGDLLITNQLRYQLRYRSKRFFKREVYFSTKKTLRQYKPELFLGDGTIQIVFRIFFLQKDSTAFFCFPLFSTTFVLAFFQKKLTNFPFPALFSTFFSSSLSVSRSSPKVHIIFSIIKFYSELSTVSTAFSTVLHAQFFSVFLPLFLSM